MLNLSAFSQVAEEVARGEGAKKVIRRVSGECAVIIAEFPEDSYIIALRRGEMTESVVAKIVPSTKATEVPWECGYLDYVPHGYYAVAEDPEAFRSKLVNKLRSLRNLVKSGRI